MSDDVLAAVEFVLEQGGEPDDVLRSVVSALATTPGLVWAGIAFHEEDELVLGPQAGRPEETRRARVPVRFQEREVGELWVDGEAEVRSSTKSPPASARMSSSAGTPAASAGSRKAGSLTPDHAHRRAHQGHPRPRSGPRHAPQHRDAAGSPRHRVREADALQGFPQSGIRGSESRSCVRETSRGGGRLPRPVGVGNYRAPAREGRARGSLPLSPLLLVITRSGGAIPRTRYPPHTRDISLVRGSHPRRPGRKEPARSSSPVRARRATRWERDPRTVRTGRTGARNRRSDVRTPAREAHR